MRPNDLESWLTPDAPHAAAEAAGSDSDQNPRLPPRRRPMVMGILNVTPDSFSDGGKFLDSEYAKRHVDQMLSDGADWIDIGGESTRPGSEPVDADEQLRRVLPAIEAAAKRDVVVSIDTSSAAVARAALDAGACVVNDVTAGRADPGMLGVMATARACCLMHMLGTPATMQQSPAYDDVVAEVERHLLDCADAAVAAGVERGRILLDPGIGFGKTTAHNLALLRATPRLASIGFPLLIGTSRKRFLGELTNEPDPASRQFATAATVALAVRDGASVVRVHDVRAMRQVVDVTWAIDENTHR